MTAQARSVEPVADFDVRAWLAKTTGCAREGLRPVGPNRPDFGGRWDVRYECNGVFAGRVLVGPAKTNIETERPRRSVIAVWPDGSAAIRIDADVEIVW